MGLPLEDYGLIGDLQTAALVGRDGSIDWLCLPDFDSDACFTALLGTPDHGRWLLAPATPAGQPAMRYRGDSLVLETEHLAPSAGVRIIDFMPPRDEGPQLVRIVEGVSGRVRMRMEFSPRFEYGDIVPWIHPIDGGVTAVGGAHALRLETPVELHGNNHQVHAEFEVEEGQRVPFVLGWFRSYEEPPQEIKPDRALEQTEMFWRKWFARCGYEGRWSKAVTRSLITLKALTYAPSGGILAAPTTSLPEAVGGGRNWDYRYSWLRDAAETVEALLMSGFEKEAGEWRDWLLRTVAGDPAHVHVLYGVRGEHRVDEMELEELPGYRDSRPVRIGNSAAQQLQLDVWGEVMDCFHRIRVSGLDVQEHAWELQRRLMETLEGKWRHPDQGIWEVRGSAKHFTHSKVLAWVAFDRAVKAIEMFGLDGPADRWRALRDEVREEVLREGYNERRGSFVQHYGSKKLDAALLLIPLVGFLPGDDPRVVGTIEAVQRELSEDGLVYRYDPERELEGIEPEEEGAFVACSFWLAGALALAGRREEGIEVFEKVLSIRNEVGLLSEEYDPGSERLVGNFPQAFSHIWLATTALELDQYGGGRTRHRH